MVAKRCAWQGKAAHACVGNGIFRWIHSKKVRRILGKQIMCVHTSAATACAIVPLQSCMLRWFDSEAIEHNHWTHVLFCLRDITQKQIVLFLDLWMLFSIPRESKIIRFEHERAKQRYSNRKGRLKHGWWPSAPRPFALRFSNLGDSSIIYHEKP